MRERLEQDLRGLAPVAHLSSRALDLDRERLNRPGDRHGEQPGFLHYYFRPGQLHGLDPCSGDDVLERVYGDSQGRRRRPSHHQRDRNAAHCRLRIFIYRIPRFIPRYAAVFQKSVTPYESEQPRMGQTYVNQ